MTQSQLRWQYDSPETPFPMPKILTPQFSECPHFSITENGAVEGDKEANSAAIYQAILQAHQTKGGVVVVPPGRWKTGPILFRSFVELRLEQGATLVFSGEPKDYLPPVRTSWEGMECLNYSPLIYGFECQDISISGEGLLEAEMDVWTKWFERPHAHMEGLKRIYFHAAENAPMRLRDMTKNAANFRPQFIHFNRCERVRIEGISIQNSPFWCIHPFLCNNVVVKRVRIEALGHNNDGVDPEMCENVLIENCEFNQGDDAVSIKSGRNQEAWRLNSPSRNIVVRNCRILNGHQLVAIGSELSGGIENVLIENCQISPSSRGLKNLLYVKTNERRGGYVRNITMRNIECGVPLEGILSIETDVLYQWKDLVPTLERRLTKIEDIHVEAIAVEEVGQVARLLGQKELPIEIVSVSRVQSHRIREADQIENVVGFQCDYSGEDVSD